MDVTSSVEPGQSWAYRARRIDELVEVVVVRIGAHRPARVLVRFADASFEGRQEWVPPARLKVLWADVGEYRAWEERWDRVQASAPADGDQQVDVAEHVVETLFDADEVWLDYRAPGVLQTADPAGLARRLGLAEQQLTAHPDSFVEDGVHIAPWEVTELVARTAVRQDPRPFVAEIRREERKARYEAIHGRWSRGGRGGDFSEPEFCADFDADYLRPRREVLLSWCGAQAVEEFDELAELRKEIRRVGDLAQSAIDALKTAGHTAEASRLQRELGTPVEMLRYDEPDDEPSDQPQ